MKKHQYSYTLRCINCESLEIRLAYSRKQKKWFTKCSECNWVNKYLEDLTNGS